jgi:hypothetical protein
MISFQIDNILRSSQITSKYYKGCFPADKITQSISAFPACMVVNTDGAGDPGEHWTAIFVQDPLHVEYFDSLGDWPPSSTAIGKYLTRFPMIKHNGGIRFQSERSAACGEFAIYFLHMRCKGLGFGQILKRLNSAKGGPNVLVKNFTYYLANAVGTH